MQSEEQHPDDEFCVVVNEEGQYSIWFADRKPPSGWQIAWQRGPKQACLDYIASVWTDMRPLSLRRDMEMASPSA